jgi:hypothetical protein
MRASIPAFKSLLAIALLSCASLGALAQEAAPVYKCVDARGRVSYGNDPSENCSGKKLLDTAKLGHGMTMPAYAAKSPQPASPSAAAPIQAPIERLAESLGIDVLGKGPAVDPTARAIEKATKP